MGLALLGMAGLLGEPVPILRKWWGPRGPGAAR